MEVQSALGSDIALAFDECTPYHADRDYTARSTERTHRWLDRCLSWHERQGPARQAVFGIVQGGCHEDLRRTSAQFVSEAGVDGIAIGGTLGRDKEEMREVLGLTAPLLPPEAPKHLLGIGEVDDLLDGVALGLDLFDCAVPTRLARHGVALAPEPERRFRLDLRKAGHEGDRRPLADGCPCPACTLHDRDYLSYLSRAEELTAVRLLVLHNLTFLERLMAAARGAIAAGRFAAYREAVLAGAGRPERRTQPSVPVGRPSWRYWVLSLTSCLRSSTTLSTVSPATSRISTPAALSVVRITTAATAAAIRTSATSAITARTKRLKAERLRRGAGAAAGCGGLGRRRGAGCRRARPVLGRRGALERSRRCLAAEMAGRRVVVGQGQRHVLSGEPALEAVGQLLGARVAAQRVALEGPQHGGPDRLRDLLVVGARGERALVLLADRQLGER